MAIAAVTGASSGIGKEFAHQLARNGHDLILIARREEALHQVAGQLRDKYRVQITVHSSDLTDPESLEAIEKEFSETRIDLLVNNAGFALWGEFQEHPIEREQQLLDLNVAAVMRLTHAVLPQMLERDDGGVINVSSVAGFAPAWLNNTYPASKAWVLNFTEALGYGVMDSGVTVMALCPGYTRTEFWENADVPQYTWVPSWFQLRSRHVVSAALRDFRRGKVVSIPTLRYKLVVTALRYTPRWILRRFALR